MLTNEMFRTAVYSPENQISVEVVPVRLVMAILATHLFLQLWQMDEVYEVSASVAREFNMQGNLERGCTIAGFLRVGRAMLAHGAV